MRKHVLFVILAAAVVILSSSPAHATTQIVLMTSTDGSIVFTPTGGSNLSMSFGTCTLGNCIIGPANGASTSGFYQFSGGPISLTFAGSGTWNTSGTISFKYNSASNFLGTNFLSGTLKLVDLVQSGTSGIFNTNLVVDITALSGTLAGLFPFGIIPDVRIDLDSINLATISSPASATILDGSMTAATPEPSSMLLLGTGLVAVGAFLRRRWLTS